jgi:uncharacterized membrane protein
MITKSFSNLSSFEKFFYLDWWPDYFFVNSYPLLGVIWNIFLLSIPFILFFGISLLWRRETPKNLKYLGVLILVFFWVLFLPNSAYVITDIRHLADYCPGDNFFRVCTESAWMIIFFFVYSIVGWVAFYYSIKQMFNFIRNEVGCKASMLFVLLIIPIVSLGVVIGLINRWNSWEVFSDPAQIISACFLYFSKWEYFKNWLAFSLGLYILYFAGDYLFKRVPDKSK